MAEYLTYREAARKVQRSVKTIKRWRRHGMPMTWRGRFRVVEVEILKAWWRDRMKADPVWQAKVRRDVAERDTPTRDGDS